MNKTLLILSSAMVAAISSPAALLIEITEVGLDVQLSVSGSIDLTGATFDGIYSFAPAFIVPNSAEILANGGNGDGYTGAFASFPANIGIGGFTFASSSSGDVTFFGPTTLITPMGYVSNTPISSSSTYLGQDLASLGITPGTYNFSFTSGDTGSIVASTSAIPEPSTYIAIAGFLALGAFIVRRRRKGKAAE